MQTCSKQHSLFFEDTHIFKYSLSTYLFGNFLGEGTRNGGWGIRGKNGKIRGVLHGPMMNDKKTLGTEKFAHSVKKKLRRTRENPLEGYKVLQFIVYYFLHLKRSEMNQNGFDS